jgi:glycosyltransferase domain-containing protein
MKRYPLVTVGITTYNRPRLLQKALDSVSNQSYPNLEIIVVDDCSPEAETEALVKKAAFKDSRIRYFKQDKNTGVALNVNHVLEKASGEYFMWLCDDDWIGSNYIEKCLSFILENPEYLLVSGKTLFYLSDKYLFEGEVIDSEDKSPTKRVIDFYDKHLGTANCPNFGIINLKNLKDLRLKNIQGHDNVWVSNIAFLGKIKTLDNVYIYRLLGGASQSLEKSALTFNYSKFELKCPFIALWINLIKDIAWESKAYKTLNIFQRFYLSIRLTILILWNLEKYLSRYKVRCLSFKKEKEEFMPPRELTTVSTKQLLPQHEH